MKKENLKKFTLRTFLGSVLVSLGFTVPCLADEPAVEREIVKLDPLYFEDVNGNRITNEADGQKMWNDLMKYKLWGTKSVIFNKSDFKIAEPSGYTGSALDKIIFNNGGHTLGGPILAGTDFQISYPNNMGGDNDSLLTGPVRAGWLYLPEWNNVYDVKYGGIYCFEHQIYFTQPNRKLQIDGATEAARRFIANVHKSGGKVYADWDKDMDSLPGLPNLLKGVDTLDGTYSQCPESVPQSEKELSVPKLDRIDRLPWEPAFRMVSTVRGEVSYIHIPPISAADVRAQHTWYDKFVSNFIIGKEDSDNSNYNASNGKKLYILMPSKYQNANGKTGRLTRIFSRDGFNFSNDANDTKIQVVYVNEDATWNDSTGSWDNLVMNKATIVVDSLYAGNLLFYTPKDIHWASMVDIDYQGTFMTAGNFTIENHMNLAGQLIAGKTLSFESDVNGRFHYVPFNSPEIKTDVFVKSVFKESDEWHEMNFYLTDTALTDVSFDYCFAFFGTDIDTTGGKYDNLRQNAKGTFAELEDLDLADNKYTMPLCSKGEVEHIAIGKGSRTPSKPSHIKVKVDELLEGDEYMVFKVMNLNGAIISGNKFDGGIVVQLVDLTNKAPKFVNVDRVNLNVLENKAKAVAGRIGASDEDDDELSFSIKGGNAQDLFEIEASTGVVSMKDGVEPFDYEAWKEGGSSYQIRVEVCDIKTVSYVQLCDDRLFTVNITDVNEKPYFTDPGQIIYIAESEQWASETVKFTDTDKFNTDGSLTNDEVVAIGGDTDIFAVTKNGMVYTKSGVVLDYETRNTYKITLRVRDTDTENYPDLYDEVEFSIVVTDVIDGPKFEFETYNGTVAENSVVSTEVDMDNLINATTSQVGATITYSLLDETKSFMINPNTGAITVAENANLDFEKKNVYEMKVVASDVSGDANQTVQTDTATVFINLVDINEKPVFVEPTEPLKFPENAKGYEIGTLTFDDLDTASRFRRNKFELVEEVDGLDLDEDGVLTTTRKFDYETEPKTYELTVRISDISKPELTTVGKITVELLNMNEPPFLKETVFSVLESDTVGTIFKQSLEGVDLDDPENSATYNYYILDGSDETSANGDFKLDSLSGKFTVATSLDYETKESYSFRVRVKDAEGGYSDTTITINVIDVNETPFVKVDTVYVYENQKLDEPFGSVKTDRDDPDTKNPDFRNNFYEKTDNGEIFKVETNGDVVLLKTIDYETDSLYTLDIRVTDRDDSSLTSTKKVVVKVVDVYEKSEVEIIRAETKDSIYLRPDTIYVNTFEVTIEWKEDEKTRSSKETLTEGPNVIIKTYHDKTKNDPGADTVVIFYSTAAPLVTVSADGDNVGAENIYTVVEKTSDGDSSIYVNDTRNDIRVTVKDTAAHVSKSFTVKLELDTVSVPTDEFKNVTKIADMKIAREQEPLSGMTTIPENGNYMKNVYTKMVNGVEVTVSYYTDKKGKDVKRSVITSSGKKKEIAVIEVSYTIKVDGKDVTLSYFADASTGERVKLNTGLFDSESVLSADGDDVAGSYTVSYNYVDNNGNTVEVTYFLDEKGRVVKNHEGNVGFNVGYTYVNKFGNSSKKDVLIVLDQKGPVVKIESPTEDEVLTSNFTDVKWTVNGVVQDTLKVQGFENGMNTIIRVFRDKAGNESRDSVRVMVKNVKNIDISIEKPVTIVDIDSVEKYYKSRPPRKGQTYGVTFYNYEKKAESETIVGIDGETETGSGEEPYPGLDSHLGPTLVVDARVPVVNALGGLATLDDIVSAGGMIALDGVDAANSRKVTVSEYVENYCTDEFKQSMQSDYSKMNLYWTTLKVDVWVYTKASSFVERNSFEYNLDDPAYVNEAGLLKFFYELTPDENGYVRTNKGRLYGSGAFIFKVEVKMSSKLRCDLPTSPEDADKNAKKKNSVLKSSDELLKSFGYRRPVDK